MGMYQFWRKLALLLTVILLISTASVAAASESYSGTWGELNWYLDGNSGRLTISGAGPMEDLMLFDMNGQTWRSHLGLVKEVVIEPGITSVGICAFAEAQGLIRVSLPEGLSQIGASSFSSCDALEQIQIPEGVTEIGEYAFTNCEALREISLPDTVKTIKDDAFRGCTALTSVKIPEGVTEISSYCFHRCSNLSEVQLPTGLTAIHKCAFGDCGLRRFQISAGVVSLGDAFLSGCPLEELTVSRENRAFVMRDDVLYSADGRELIMAMPTICGRYTVSEGVEVVRSAAFENCAGLTELSFPASITSMDSSTFFGCTNLQSIQVAEGCHAYRSDDGVLINLNYMYLMYCPKGFQGAYTLRSDVTRIAESAFAECTGLTEVNIHGEVESIGSAAFRNCTALQKATLEENTSDWAEYANLTLDYGLFENCTSLTSFAIPASVKKVQSSAFEGCTNLTKLTVSEKSTTFAADEAGNLYNKEKNQLVRCPEGRTGVFTVPEGVKVLNDCAFLNCTRLEEIRLPEGLESIALGAFSGCSGLRELTIPKGVRRLYANACLNCDGLQNIYVYPMQCRIIGDDFLGDESTVIWGYEGSDIQAYAQKTGQTFQSLGSKTPFVDVQAGQFFYQPVVWAGEQDITEGVDATHFAPYSPCTRGQVVTFLWRAVKSPEPVGTTCTFVDLNPDAYYYKAVLWAVENGITEGIDATHFGPDQTVTRGQFVTFLWRTAGKPASVDDNPFVDLKPDAYYHDAVLWAAANGITVGMTQSTFGPDRPCTRGQVVTFLYRNFTR